MKIDSRDDARRRMLRTVVAVPALAATAGLRTAGAADAPPRRPTPACGSDGRSDGRASVTPRQTAGPYFTPRSPQRASLLEPGIDGARLELTGRVWTPDCRPVAGALLDFWQADAAGDYDNAGYRLRGHQFADAQGRFRLETVVPGRYPGRTPHLHVKVQPPGGAVLTTQLYFPGEAASNRRDFIFDPALQVSVASTEPVMIASYDFVIVAG